MNKYIKSFRLRTLPLSTAGVILGNCLFVSFEDFSFSIFLLSFFTAVILQILSNLANELGDYYHGLDTEQHEGPSYGLQQGIITVRELKNEVIFFCCLAVIVGTILLYVTFETLFSIPVLFFLLLGASAIIAALKYTLGKKAYGYHAMGDLFVFIFFGIVSVIGCNYLQVRAFYPSVIFPAIAIGCLSVAVLNLNNIRDIKNDFVSGRITVAGKLGEKNAKIYQAVLAFLAVICMVIFGRYEALLMIPVYFYHIVYIFKYSGAKLDKQMLVLSVSTLFLSLMCSIMSLIGL